MADTLFRIAPLSLQHCQEICSWKYDPPYDIYNWNSWEKMKKDQEEFADPLIRQEQYGSVLDRYGLLCGFVQFFPLVDGTRLGLGMRPDLCGQGLGVPFVKAIVHEAVLRDSRKEIDLEVLVWNERAFNVYSKAGFVVTDQYVRNTPAGPAEFYCMVYQPPF
ncbi:GNAT family N-acetyltransferase [Paenibacillus sp. J2TS4]|uniref:GNAT family N-acetyltransferase n=1 Tax=Paenibacillus sp. J2TS4 TaxID=2807194 RepID=UPI001B028434|nr:GNAT family protein [Paenibacillus sp. J2TS4]GIP35673.1 N-acetyltransferase [Paenibacillus sp. J2TS4]